MEHSERHSGPLLPTQRRERLAAIARAHDLVVGYLLGSRAQDGKRHLDGESVSGEGSDIDVAVLLRKRPDDPLDYGCLYADFEELMAPMRCDLATLNDAGAFFRENAIRGIEVFCTDPHYRDEYELYVLRTVGDLLPIQRQIERDTFGWTNK